jgi:peptidoglycan biosynthesis protein MviN/MurJ (putative lipid II flippase)
MSDLTLGVIIGIVIQTGFTAVILLKNEFRDRRARREREEVEKMLRSAIPMSTTSTTYNV